MIDSFSFVRRVSQLGTLIMTRLRGERVGDDSWGNRYFRSRHKDSSGRESRWVLYSGEPEASKVPPEWFGWLHHTCDHPLPSAPENRYVWQKPHQPNLTGTEVAPLPTGHPLNRMNEKGALQATGSYQSWNPPT